MFPSVDIGAGSILDSAYVLFDVDEVRPGQSDVDCLITIFGEKNTNPAAIRASRAQLLHKRTRLL